jgi:surfactin synthase thioesterase subunit
MGALLAYETAVELEAMGYIPPRQIFVSGALPPFLEKDKPVSHLSDGDFLEHLRELAGTPEKVLNNSDAMQFFLPILRSDFSMVESYRPTALRLLHVSLKVLSGQKDEETPAEKMRMWQNVTMAAAAFREYPGGHFFFSEPAVRQEVFRDLEILRREV